ncbi:hypothetical protein [Nitrososphaera sp.]|uniref:hypothetical protein n=1 Tax=Nitrososphaera sp. TaxID=1971748 RepID=UPI0031795B30
MLAILLPYLIVADSHMAMVLPDDISARISDFVAGRRGFPFIEKGETMCVMYLYGKTGGVTDADVKEATELAGCTAEQVSADVDRYRNSSKAMLDPEYIRSKFVNRGLQLAVEKKHGTGRLAGDPAVLADCFAQHVAFYRQDHFFGLYGPLKEAELTADIRAALVRRMVMVCYNKKSEKELGTHPLIPVYVWFRDRAGLK